MTPTSWQDYHDDCPEKYNLYLAGREWGLLRRAVRERCKGICERCYLHRMHAVHHLTYIRKYREEPGDLQGLCRGCHDFVHGISDVNPLKIQPQFERKAHKKFEWQGKKPPSQRKNHVNGIAEDKPVSPKSEEKKYRC